MSATTLHPPRADLEKIDLDGNVARATVRFLAEFRSRTKGPEGEAVDDERIGVALPFQGVGRAREQRPAVRRARSPASVRSRRFGSSSS